ncbi:uncharacterized protein EI90DRAFT_3117305 [Cantharellus anzutake]|uniref:uncharacterized protein n=1 Tax=Cantharellus anzutake TaxID=1750568 RepID=UPI001907836B|nr:uncharacterized protein EI90DRAFT_3117305 [Cantharellus anzutake]KAF8340754.1 hypothetical protein EI90DRAFT_3117305 [Cantharellus anzutake]
MPPITKKDGLGIIKSPAAGESMHHNGGMSTLSPIINPMLHTIFGWNDSVQMVVDNVQRGADGVKGLVGFLEWFVHNRGLNPTLFDTKLEKLSEAMLQFEFEELRTGSSTQVPGTLHTPSPEAGLSSTPSPDILKLLPQDESPNLVSDDEGDAETTSDFLVTEHRAERLCGAQRLDIPASQSPYYVYPFGLHAVHHVPWDIEIGNDTLYLRSRKCCRIAVRTG